MGEPGGGEATKGEERGSDDEEGGDDDEVDEVDEGQGEEGAVVMEVGLGFEDHPDREGEVEGPGEADEGEKDSRMGGAEVDELREDGVGANGDDGVEGDEVG